MSRRVQTARISSFKKSWPAILAATTIIQLFLFQWARRWVKSGAPALSLFILLGEANGKRILPFVHLWTLFATVNLIYAIASTSWLLYWVFTAICYPAIFITCLFQFQAASALTRKFMRVFIRQLHFIGDKVAFFEIPALEIDTEVDGLMVLRGITFSLSTLSFEVHGVEVGIKLSDDLELAIQTENVTVSLFRGIDVGDCYANLKGGPHEMTFVDMERKTNADSQEALMVDTLLPKGPQGDRPELIRMKSEMTHGNPPKDSSYVLALKAMRRYRLDKVFAEAQYNKVLGEIHETSTVQTARKNVDGAATSLSEDAVRAAICSKLHSKPSVPHPPMRSVKVTTLQRLSPPRVRRFLHRLPMLLRLLLNPISYFHPIKVASVTATASGRWIDTILEQTLFKGYGDYDSDVAAVKARICKWVSDANFAVVLGSMQGNAHVPVDPSYDITCQILLDQILAFRALPLAVDLNQVVSLGGADASVSIPSALLPHHEHLIPERPGPEVRQNTVQSHPTPRSDWSSRTTREDESNGEPEQESESEKDQVPMKFAARVHLPAKFDQELLDFVALIVKASKLVELEEIARTTTSSPSSSSFPSEVGHKISEVAGTLNKKMKGGLKKAVIANDQWLAKLVGKLMRKMEMVNGDLGYTGEVPIELEPYRRTGWLEEEGEKLLK
ncbi:hypothetical protein E4U30_004845 [Claviceps sp. LM220 group G6]|nr:hypothetical protein E4U30_004845 [Claviceps sp. LM220 group G6]KAG6122747.1 hypothetical protein E4U14_004870 [Claviceps sp. LM454 group G7]